MLLGKCYVNTYQPGCKVCTCNMGTQVLFINSYNLHNSLSILVCPNEANPILHYPLYTFCNASKCNLYSVQCT